MSSESGIRELVEQLLESKRTPEEVCAGDEELLGAVRERMRRHLALDEQLANMFPEDAPTPAAVAPAPALGPSPALAPKTLMAAAKAGPQSVPEGNARRARAAFVVGSAPSACDDVAQILRRRLLVLALLVAGNNTFFAIQGFTRPPAAWHAGLADVIQLQPMAVTHSVVAAFFWAISLLLWRRKRIDVRWLRAVELTGLIAIAGHIHWDTWYFNTAQLPLLEVTQPAFGNVLVNTNSLDVVFIIFGYGVFIPNTWLRCFTILGSLVTLSIAFCAWSLPWQSLPQGYLPSYLTTMAVYYGTATVLAVYAAGRISILRVQVRQAQRLGQYILRERLGGGGMGEVFRADHALLRRPAAVKLIRPDRAGDPAILALFEREVQATASLSHPNTIQIFDYGHTDDGTFYYVMEYLDGLTLLELVRLHGPLPPARAVFLLCQICRALREAHAIGLIHRDIKPGNVIVCQRGGMGDVVKLLDFGLVRSHAEKVDNASLTQFAVAGTPAYMSPEQAMAAGKVDGRSDIYSLGAVAYFLLTGTGPFAGRTPVQTLAAHIVETPAPLTAHRADVPGELQAIISRCLAKNPADRFPDAASLQQALEACPTGQPWTEEEASKWWRRSGA